MAQADRFHDAVAVVTGASRGLGLALAHALADRGAKVAMIARDVDVLAAAADRLRRRGGTVAEIAIDVAAPGAAQTIAARAHAELGRPTLLIHAASTLGAVPLPLLADTEPDDLARTFAVNVFAPFALTRALLGSLVFGRPSVVVNISSDAAVEAYPRWGAYGATKAALDHLTRTWAAELDGVRVLAVDPGEMDTQMHADAIPDADRASLADPQEVAATVLDMIADDRRAPSGARLRAVAWEVGR